MGCMGFLSLRVIEVYTTSFFLQCFKICVDMFLTVFSIVFQHVSSSMFHYVFKMCFGMFPNTFQHVLECSKPYSIILASLIHVVL
jgi:hypothetical protein